MGREGPGQPGGRKPPRRAPTGRGRRAGRDRPEAGARRRQGHRRNATPGHTPPEDRGGGHARGCDPLVAGQFDSASERGIGPHASRRRGDLGQRDVCVPVTRPRGTTPPIRAAERRAVERWLGRITPDAAEHWLWPGYVDAAGYGRLIVEQRGARVQWPAHQLVWLVERGPVPAGLSLIPACDLFSCVNPEHWKPATMRERVAAGNSPAGINAHKDTCCRNHSLTDPANLAVSPAGRRICRASRRERQAGRTRRQRRDGSRL